LLLLARSSSSFACLGISVPQSSCVSERGTSSPRPTLVKELRPDSVGGQLPALTMATEPDIEAAFESESEKENAAVEEAF
jgi:hypothetical protein